MRHRVEAINQAFAASIAEFNYQNKYCGVFPIKVNQLREVVEEILDAGKPYQFGLEVGSKPELFAGLANDKRISFDTRNVQAVELRGDPRKLQQILMNLIQNAIDASSVGGTIALRLTGNLTEVFIALAVALATFGLINAAAVYSGVWVTRERVAR